MPRQSELISHVDWWSGFLVFEGKAELTHSGNTDPETLRRARRHIFKATTRRRSVDWDEYDRITEADKRDQEASRAVEKALKLEGKIARLGEGSQGMRAISGSSWPGSARPMSGDGKGIAAMRLSRPLRPRPWQPCRARSRRSTARTAR